MKALLKAVATGDWMTVVSKIIDLIFDYKKKLSRDEYEKDVEKLYEDPVAYANNRYSSDSKSDGVQSDGTDQTESGEE